MMNGQGGVVTGIVSDLNDPAGEGRIRVRLVSLPGEPLSAWAPMMSPLAGPRRGLYFMPEVNEEVLVAFDHGDLNSPRILGCVWNGRDRPPETNTQMRVVLVPGGHTLRFEDVPSAPRIILRSKGRHEITVDDTPGTGQSVTVRSAGGLKLTLDDKTASIKLEGGGRTLTMQAGMLTIT